MKRGLKHHHWAGLTKYTSLYRLALGYVFGKQSGRLCYSDLQMHTTFLKCTNIDIPSAEATGLICRVPLVDLALHVLAFSARAPVPVVGTVD